MLESEEDMEEADYERKLEIWIEHGVCDLPISGLLAVIGLLQVVEVKLTAVICCGYGRFESEGTKSTCMR